jgi:VanZ family protein
LRPWPQVRDFLSYWLPPFLGTAAILVLSGDLGASSRTLNLVNWLLSWAPFLSPAHLETLNAALRKGGHLFGYGILFSLWFRALRGRQVYGRGKSVAWSLAVCLAVALVDEGHQCLVSSRTGSFPDVALDLAGATLGAVLTRRRWSSRSRGAWGQ